MAGSITAEELFRRVAVVEKTIADRGWSMQIQQELARELGCCKKSVYNYRQRLIDGLKDELDGQDRDTRRSEFLNRLRGHQRAALESGRMGPLASMMALESRIVGGESPTSQDVGGSVQVVLKVPDLLSNETG